MKKRTMAADPLADLCNRTDDELVRIGHASCEGIERRKVRRLIAGGERDPTALAAAVVRLRAQRADMLTAFHMGRPARKGERGI